MLIKTNKIKDILIENICNAHFKLDNRVIRLIKKSIKEETSLNAKKVLQMILDNNIIAQKQRIPLCQDTGTAIYIIEQGYKTYPDMPWHTFLDNITKQVYKQCNLRKSIVKDPVFNRTNTNNNTPSIIHIEEKDIPHYLKIHFIAKGAGSENKSGLFMLNPTDTKADIQNHVVQTIKDAGGSVCPPLFIGIGIGGTADYAMYLSKKALINMFKKQSKKYLQMEKEILNAVNNTNVGPMGYGGKTTALKVRIESYGTHIASLPIAITLQCHSFRFYSFTMEI